MVSQGDVSVVRARHDRENPFTRISNVALRDSRLSFRARGILAYVLSHKDGWRHTARTLTPKGREGRDACLRALDELETLGYSRVIYVNDGGNVTKRRVFSEVPCSPEIPSNTSECSPEIPNYGKPVGRETCRTDSQALLEQASDSEGLSCKNKHAPPKEGAGEPAPFYSLIPTKLATPAFRAAWDQWASFWPELTGRKFNSSTARLHLEKIGVYGQDDAIRSLETAIKRGYREPAKPSRGSDVSALLPAHRPYANGSDGPEPDRDVAV